MSYQTISLNYESGKRRNLDYSIYFWKRECVTLREDKNKRLIMTYGNTAGLERMQLTELTCRLAAKLQRMLRVIIFAHIH